MQIFLDHEIQPFWCNFRDARGTASWETPLPQILHHYWDFWGGGGGDAKLVMVDIVDIVENGFNFLWDQKCKVPQI